MAAKKVLIIDDSALVRTVLTRLINSLPDFEVMATAADPYMAAEKLKKGIPDLITLDIEMPRMDGITFLRTLMSQYPIPVVIISSLTERGSATALQALQYGAVEVIHKPDIHSVGLEIPENRIRIIDAISAAALARVVRKSATKKAAKAKPSRDDMAEMRPYTDKSMVKTTEKVVVMGASTGGTEALRTILSQLPSDAPGTVIVQHMPEKFTHYFAESLDQLCRVKVKEAENGDSIVRGTVLIAPGNHHVQIRRSGARYLVNIKDGPLVNRHRPSVDVLFRSAAQFVGSNCTGIILTGMGADGAAGMLEMKSAGALTIAQDEASSVVFGMPREAIALGGVDKVVSLNQINRYLI